MNARSILSMALWPPLLFIFAACSSDDDGVKTPPQITYVENQLSEKGAHMGYALFRQLVDEQPGANILISPWSLQSAVMMAAEGAVGPAREELEALMQLDGASLLAARSEYKEVRSSLTSTIYHPTVRSANAFFYDGGRVNVNAPYLDLLNAHYQASAQNLTFSNPASKAAINTWASQQTNGLIPEILVDAIPENQIFYLINALYFKSDWMQGFDARITSDGDFHRGDGTVKQVPMMFDQRNVLYAQHDGLQMLDLTFRDSTLSLSLIRPQSAELSDLSWLDKTDPQGLETLYGALAPNYMMVRVPRMELKFKEDLIPTLMNMGMSAPFFNPPANFSGISTQSGQQIALDPILHEVVLKVDEKGAEGAAVTTIGGVVTSLPPTLNFDRPFVLCLRHIPTGVQLFYGLVDNPLP